MVLPASASRRLEHAGSSHFGATAALIRSGSAGLVFHLRHRWDGPPARRAAARRRVGVGAWAGRNTVCPMPAARRS